MRRVYGGQLVECLHGFAQKLARASVQQQLRAAVECGRPAVDDRERATGGKRLQRQPCNRVDFE